MVLFGFIVYVIITHTLAKKLKAFLEYIEYRNTLTQYLNYMYDILYISNFCMASLEA